MLHLELLLRILVGTVLGGAIGYERDLHGRRPAGLRTHTIVALASATFMVISTRFMYFSPVAAVIDQLTKIGATVTQEDYERQVDEGRTRATCEVRLPAAVDDQDLIRALERDEAIRYVKIERI